jgi:hypothetical protein
MKNSVILAARTAKVGQKTVYRHREQDAEFAEQWSEAVGTALDLQHARVWHRSLEGDLEPIVYMGVVVSHVRKFDSKFQIEMLRAWQPDRFKTPGLNLNVGVKGSVLVLTEAERHELQGIVKAQIDSYPTDPQEWDKYLEEHSFGRPQENDRQTDLSHNANELEGETP